MTYWNYTCPKCGFFSEEQLAVYKCPKCGSQMKFRKGGYRGEIGVVDRKFIVYFFESFILLVISFIFFPIGIIISILIVLITRKLLNKRYRDKAIRLHCTDVIYDNGKNYYCPCCGLMFYGQRPNCPYCGCMINYDTD